MTGTGPLNVTLRKRLSAAFTLDVSFHAHEGITVLFGPSGAGKTTLLDCVAGLQQPDSGKISIGERRLYDSVSRESLATAHRNIGYVFQSLALFPHLTVEDNVQYGVCRLDSQERSRRTAAILASFHIDGLRRRRPAAISGGERQRAALARALVTDPCALLLDEPLSALDAATKRSIMDDLRRWNEEHSIPILYITHNREELFALGERVIALEAGKIVAEGNPQEILSAPRQEALAQAAGFENIFDASVTAVHEQSGTMTVRVGDSTDLEVPLAHAVAGDRVRIAIRSGDILLANREPEGLSARNILPGRITSLSRKDVMVVAMVDCGAKFEVHLTPAAEQSLGLRQGSQVWLVLKTHSCHLVR